MLFVINIIEDLNLTDNNIFPSNTKNTQARRSKSNFVMEVELNSYYVLIEKTVGDRNCISGGLHDAG